MSFLFGRSKGKDNRDNQVRLDDFNRIEFYKRSVV